MDELSARPVFDAFHRPRARAAHLDLEAVRVGQVLAHPERLAGRLRSGRGDAQVDAGRCAVAAARLQRAEEGLSASRFLRCAWVPDARVGA